MVNLSLKERIHLAEQAIKQGKKLALYLAKDANNSQHRYRVYNPLQATSKSQKWQAVYFFNAELQTAYKFLDQAAIVIIERQNPSGSSVPDFIHAAHERGIHVAFDLDDLVFDYRQLGTLMYSINNRNPLRWLLYFHRIRRIAKLADSFITTNDFLGRKLQRSFHKPYQLVRNSLNDEQVNLKLKKPNHQGFVMGYFSGTPTHAKDFASIEPQLIKFLQTHDDAKLLVVGHMQFSPAIKQLIQAGRIEIQPFTDYLKLQALIASVDVNLAPLVINDFTNCKSELKFFEAAIVETTTIASPTYAYRHSITEAKTGFLAKPNEWYQKLEYLYTHPAKNYQIAQAAKQYTLKHYYGAEFLQELEQVYDTLYQQSTRKISVIIPNYNYAKYLKKRIASIVQQTHPIYELIILDDHSTDHSTQIIKAEIKKLQVTRPQLSVKFIPNQQNSGRAILQWQKAFEEATGDYIWLAEADDLSHRDFLKTAMQGFRDPEVVLSYANSKAINQKGITIVPRLSYLVDKERTGHFKQDYCLDGETEIRQIMAIRCAIRNVSAVIFKNDSAIPYAKYLKAAAKYQQVGDWYFYLQILKHGKIAYFKKPLNYFRLHSSSATKKSQQDGVHYRELLALHQYILKEFPIPKPIQKAMQKEAARIKQKHGIDN